MTSQSRRGGPKTAVGKARSASNAKIHGLTSKLPADAQEKALIEAYAKELIDHYKPKSPLEILQIERIALCRAKLQYLYDLERVKIALASKELESQPERILEKITGVSALARGMAQERITEGEVYLPCRLDISLLKVICQEIEGHSGAIENKHQFARALPKLTKYLNNYPVVNLNNTDQWMEKLAEITKRLERISEKGEHYAGRWSEIIEGYLLGKEYEYLLQEEKSKLKQEYFHQQLGRQAVSQSQAQSEDGLKSQPSDFVFPDSVKLRLQLKKFTDLLMAYWDSEKLVTQYYEIKELMTQAISLPAAESDLLMRYQTTLERRLSSAIGELLALQRAHA
jgi:hypothetical protein